MIIKIILSYKITIILSYKITIITNCAEISHASFSGTFSGAYGPLGGSKRNDGEIWRAYAVPMLYMVQTQPLCTALMRCDAYRTQM
jgi:ABC-type microcin C transport system permease subunit YejE